MNNTIEDSVSEISVCATESIPLALKAFLQNIRNNIKICCPVVIKDYDYQLRIATVLPLVKFAYRSVEGSVKYIDRKEIQVHTLQNTFFNYTVDWQFYKGDTGLLIVCDNDFTHLIERKKYFDTNQSSYFWNLGSGIDTHWYDFPEYKKKICGISHSAQVHNYVSGFFIPQSWTDYNLDKVKDCIDNDDKYLSANEKEDYQIYLGTSVGDYGDKKYDSIDSCHIGVKNGIKDDDDRSSIILAASNSSSHKTAFKMQNDRLVVQQRLDSREYDAAINFGDSYNIQASLKDDDGKIEFALYNDPDENDSSIAEGDMSLNGQSGGNDYCIEYKDATMKVSCTNNILESRVDESYFYKNLNFHLHFEDVIEAKINNTIIKLTSGTLNFKTSGTITVKEFYAQGCYVNVNGTNMNLTSIDSEGTSSDYISISARHWEYVDEEKKIVKPVGLRCPAFQSGPWKGHESASS